MTFKRLGKGIAALLVIVAIVFVSFKVLGYTEQMKMNSIVNSEEAKGVYEKDLKYIDKDAFTQQGVIHRMKFHPLKRIRWAGLLCICM